MREEQHTSWAKEQKERLAQEELTLILACANLEGDESFCAWWDDDAKVPHFGSRRERIALLKDRMERLLGVAQ